MYPMPYALFLASCSMGSHMLLFLDLAFPSYFQSLWILPGLPFTEIAEIAKRLLWGSVAPFYLWYSPIESWDSLPGYVHPGIACLAFQASDWLGAFWASLSD